MAGVKDGIWKRGNNWYISVKVNGRRRLKSFGRDRKAAELALAPHRVQESFRCCPLFGQRWSK